MPMRESPFLISKKFSTAKPTKIAKKALKLGVLSALRGKNSSPREGL
jgi:hypothetical protein